VRGGRETLLAHGGYGDSGGVGLVDGYGSGVVGGADLPVGRRGVWIHTMNFKWFGDWQVPRNVRKACGCHRKTVTSWKDNESYLRW